MVARKINDSAHKILAGTRRLYIYIFLVLILILIANFVYSLLMQKKQEHLLVYQEAKAISDLYISMQTYIADKQDVINSCPDGSFHFKGLNPERVARGVSNIFNKLSDHSIKMTSLTPRNRSNLPDPLEKQILTRMRDDSTMKEFFQKETVDNQPVYYFIRRLTISKACLQCHGEPAGSLDITGYRKEGMHIGDFAGAISLQIPARASSRTAHQNLIFLIVFTIILASVSIYLMAAFLKRMARVSRTLTGMNDQLEQRNQQLKHLEAVKGELFHMLVHDMKTPLSFMIGSLQMLQERKVGTLSTEQGDLVSLVLRGCNRLKDMIINILDINRLEEGKLEIKPEHINLTTFFTEHRETWTHFALGQRKSFTMEIETGVESIQCDPSLLERLLENLVSNAFKHTRPGEGKVKVTVRQADNSSNIVFEVADNGEGIPQEYIGRIFEKYSIARQKELGLKTDTGLGLTFCKLAAEAMGGDIDVTSTPGEGATFTLRLPPEMSRT